MKKINVLTICLLALFLIIAPDNCYAQKKSKQSTEAKHPLDELSVSGMKFRCVGPAITSGRIADIAFNPQNPFEYYVAVASGGVWKTINNGTTFDPVFDAQGSYSIGCVTIDPQNSNTIWVGSGENNGQRSVAYGDGVYKSNDGGQTWTNMGLKTSEHIGKVIVHPDNSDKVFVAAIGPLWNSGGDRGVYMTNDGGKTWSTSLSIDQHTGVSDLVMDPRNPDVMYAAAHQRRRHVFTYLGGGPSSSLYKTIDGGATWNKINTGLPKVDLGRIGLAISPANPEIIYAIVEAAEGKGGFYRSTTGGMNWEKQGSYSTSGNYYQEIIADPIEENTVYAMDSWMKVSKDGGKTFNNVGEDYKHIDNHSMWIDPTNNKHYIVGCDGGIYETWDAAKNWDFKANLPVTQFYKVAVDNDEPFYNIYGGTQDNFSIGGPSRTITKHGITNRDWFITNGGDGFESQVDPENPDIVYAQSQYGVLVRYDRKSGESLGIQPKPAKGENAFRWNWDAPLAVSHHQSGRLYFAANKLFRSDDYGNSWETISEDLTSQTDRNTLKVMDKLWSMDAVAKNRSTSPYGTIVAFSESPLDQNLLVVGTDDGLIQISENGGTDWRKTNTISGVPQRSYVNAVYCSQHDANVIYAAFNHHKYGDFKPYLFKSVNKGLTWQNISSNLPARGSVYAFDQDHVNKDLLFVGTEFGVFFSTNGGAHWKQFKSGLPTIAVRDIAIQKRENDLVLGTFGRGFYVLDYYSALRSITAQGQVEESQILAIRDALLYEQSTPLGLPGRSFQGDSYYSADNLDPVAIIPYYFNEDIKSLKDQRKEKQKKTNASASGTAYPSYEELQAEAEELAPELIFTITDDTDKIVKRISQKPTKGINRFQWDLRYNSKDAISLKGPDFYNPFGGESIGTLVSPGTYTIQMSKYINGESTPIGDTKSFIVKALNNTTMPASDKKAKVAFQKDVAQLSRTMDGARAAVSEMKNKMKYIDKAVMMIETPADDILKNVLSLKKDIKAIDVQMSGDRVKRQLDIDQPPTPFRRLGALDWEQSGSTAAPTKTHMEQYNIAKEEFEPILNTIKGALQDLKHLEDKLEDADAPYTPGRVIRLLQGN